MAKKEGNHYIEEQIINLEITGNLDDKEIKEVQDNFVYFYKEFIATELQKSFDALVPPDIDLKIDSLEINLGNLDFKKPQDLSKKVQRAAKKVIKETLKTKIQGMRRQAPRSEATGRKQRFSQMSILEHFLTKGHYPSWAGQKTGSVVELMDDLLKKNTKAVAQRLMRLKNNPKAIKRLHQQFTIEQLQRVFDALYGSSSMVANKQIQLLKKRLGSATEKAILSAAIDYVLEGSSGLTLVEYKERAFTQRILEGVQKSKGGAKASSKVRTGFEAQYSNLQILEYFLEYGAIPAWADVNSKTSLQELMDNLLTTKVAGLQRLLERHIDTPNFVQRLILQFSTTQILTLLQPFPNENITFIKDSLEALSFLSSKRQAIQQTISERHLRRLVLGEVLDYFFKQKKNNFVKKTFLKNTLEQLSTASKTAYPILLKEFYKNIRRRNSTKKQGQALNHNLRRVLEQLDDRLQQKMQEERQELRTAKQNYKKVERELARLLEKQKKGTLSTIEEQQLAQLSKQAKQLEQVLLESDDDHPLDIEQLVQQRQNLQNQLRQTKDSEQEKITRRLATTNKELQKLRIKLEKDIQKAVREQEKLREQSGSIAQQRLQRITNRLNKYYRAVKSVYRQLTTDQNETTLFLTNINRALRGDISMEEKKRLRKERSIRQKELLAINQTLEELQAQEKQIEEALRNSATLLKKESESGTEEEVQATGTSKLDALIFMLQYGATPWWAEELPRQTIEELFLEFAEKAPQKLLKAFQQIGRYPVVWQRVINQLSTSAIRTVIARVYPNSSKIIFDQASMLHTIHFGQGFERLKSVDAKAFEWGVIVEYLLTNRQGFNAQDFVKEVLLQTARVHNLSPTKLLELNNTIANNNEKTLGDFLEWNTNLAKDRSVAALERELASYQQEQQAKQEGTFLDKQQELELLVEFLSSGKITERAKAFKLTSQRQFEQLLVKQLQNNSTQAKQVLFNVLRLSNARQFIIHQMQEDFFWELVLLVKPKAVLNVKRHFEDLKLLSEDNNLSLEKEVLLNVFISNASSEFRAMDFISALVMAVQQTTGRKILAILTDWKRQLQAKGSKVKSSLLLSVLLLEIDALKMEQKNVKDLELMANLNEQINFIADEYNNGTTALVDVLSAENAEAQGIDERKYRYTELEALIAKNTEEMKALEQQIQEGQPESLELLKLQRNLLQYKANLDWLELRRPPAVRIIKNNIKRLKASIQLLEEEVTAIENTGTALENVLLEEDFELSLIERQAQFLEFLEQQNPVVVDLLEPLLIDLKEEDQRHALFFTDVQNLLLSLENERLRRILLELLEKTRPSIQPLAELQRNPALEKRQSALLRDLNQKAPVELWQEWEALETYFQANPDVFTPERQALQEQIKKAIRRMEERNFRSYVSNLRKVQHNLTRQLDRATELDDLDLIQQELDALWKQQQVQADELLELARDEKARNDYKRLRRNIDHVFTRIQNTRIRRSNTIRSKQDTDPKAVLTGQVAEVKLLEEELKQVILKIEDEEMPKPKPQQPPKRKRVKEPPKPKPIDEPLQVYNAGMVLLWPYIGRLFGMLGYVKGKEWTDIDAQYKAIHILQYLVTGKTEAPENELILNKVMCGFPVTEPVPFGVEFDPKELEIAESLLVGVIKNWPKMKSLVPNSLRGSFLIREGTIKESESKWELKVQKKPFDILLKSIPWGYNFIRLPWNDYFITVEWKLL